MEGEVPAGQPGLRFTDNLDLSGFKQTIPGFYAPVHRSLAEPILLGGAPRAVAIANGTIAAAVGLGLRVWLGGVVLWALGHAAAVWAAKHDAQFVDVARRHLHYPPYLRV